MGADMRSTRPAGVPGPTMLALLFVAAAGLHAAPAARAETLVLHLADALRLARAGNWDVAGARLDVAAAQAGRRTAGAFPNPTLGWTTSKIHLDGAGDATTLGNGLWSRSYDTVAQLDQPFEIGGKRGARIGAARAALSASQARLADTGRTLEAAVVHAYVAAALADAEAGIARQSAGYLRDEARIADTRYAAGDISRAERDQIAIAAARFDLDAGRADVAARAQRIALARLLGTARPDGDVVVADSVEALAEAALPDPAAEGAGDRPDVAAARADLARAEADVASERAQRIPDPTLLLQFEHEPPDRPNTVGIGIGFPLPLWNRNGGNIAASVAARDRAALAVRQAQAQAADDLATTDAAYDEALARWRKYRDELRPGSGTIRAAVSLAYERGGASLLDLLLAQRNDNEVRQAAIEAAGDVAIAAADRKAARATLATESTQP